MKTNFPSGSPSFGDNVRIRSSVETESNGFAGLVGQVYGQTTPSVSGVEVIGELESDYAINVFFEDRHESFWFAPRAQKSHSMGSQRSGSARRMVNGAKNLSKRNPASHGGAFGTDAEQIVGRERR